MVARDVLIKKMTGMRRRDDEHRTVVLEVNDDPEWSESIFITHTRGHISIQDEDKTLEYDTDGIVYADRDVSFILHLSDHVRPWLSFDYECIEIIKE